jgi:hypothetical protein
MDASVRRPEVPKEGAHLLVPKQEDLGWETLLVRTLAEDAQLSEPGINTSRVPPIPIASDEELMPRSAAADP